MRQSPIVLKLKAKAVVSS